MKTNGFLREARQQEQLIQEGAKAIQQLFRR
jgi:hypothetical protein